MGFLKKLFKKKKGGTKLGNLIRGVANKVSGGKLGTGKNMLKVDEVPNDDLSQATASLIKTGSYKDGSVVGAQLVDIASNAINNGLDKERGTDSLLGGGLAILDNFGQKTATDYTKNRVMDFIKKYWVWVVFPVGLVIVWKLVKMIFPKMGGKKRAF